MRDRLDRGKRVDNGEWVEGCLYYFHLEGNLKNDVRCFILLPDGLIDNENEFEVIPETVGEWTGRLAEKEKKIFEGSKCILTTFDHNGYDTQHDVVVEYLGGSFFFVDKNKEHYFLVSDIEDTESDVVICGSIHDNSELLEGDAK